MPKVKVFFSNRQKEVKLPDGLRTNIRKCCEAALEEENIEDNAEVSVTMVNNNTIQKMNREYRNKIPLQMSCRFLFVMMEILM